jgi:hypothetical protein
VVVTVFCDLTGTMAEEQWYDLIFTRRDEGYSSPDSAKRHTMSSEMVAEGVLEDMVLPTRSLYLSPMTPPST